MSFKLCKFMGVPLYINIFTILLIIFLYFQNTMALSMFCISMALVLMHEYGHCYAALRVGWKVRDVVLYPFGGFACIYFKNTSPSEEIYVTIAGPLVNFALAFIYSIIGIVYFYFMPLEFPPLIGFLLLVLLNLSIALFNLIPVFPLDGGRIVRAFLSKFLDHYTATLLIVRFSQVASIVLCVLALVNGFILLGVIFIIMPVIAQRELKAAQFDFLLGEFKIKVAKILNKPELVDASSKEVLSALEGAGDVSETDKLIIDDLKGLFKEISLREVI